MLTASSSSLLKIAWDLEPTAAAERTELVGLIRFRAILAVETFAVNRSNNLPARGLKRGETKFLSLSEIKAFYQSRRLLHSQSRIRACLFRNPATKNEKPDSVNSRRRSGKIWGRIRPRWSISRRAWSQFWGHLDPWSHVNWHGSRWICSQEDRRQCPDTLFRNAVIFPREKSSLVIRPQERMDPAITAYSLISSMNSWRKHPLPEAMSRHGSYRESPHSW